MKQDIFVIYTSARTGSHIILEILAGHHDQSGGLLNTQPFWDKSDPALFNLNQHKVIHIHDIGFIDRLNLPLSQVTLILSHRRNVFAQIMSMLVAELTGEWNGKDYSNRSVTPTHVSKRKFTNMLYPVLTWPGTIPHREEFAKIVPIYHEDIIDEDNVQHIAKILDLSNISIGEMQINKKSPYCYKDIILNWQELYAEYKKIVDS